MAQQSVAETVSAEDLYKLKDFLVLHYAATDRDFSLPNGPRNGDKFIEDHYLFNAVNRRRDGSLNFQLTRAKGLFGIGFYDLVDFSYLDGSIQVQKKKVKDNQDKEKVSGLVELLGKKCYGSVISNLDQLSE